jgi:hypothetical protein
MTAPGDFFSGDVLTAADMNAIGLGFYATDNVGTDFSLSTSYTDLTNIQFTLTSTRTMLIEAYIPQIDNHSTTLNVIFELRSAASGGGSLWQQAVSSLANQSPSNVVMFAHREQLSAGTYDFYLSARTNTGTARVNNDGSTRRVLLNATDVGE